MSRIGKRPLLKNKGFTFVELILVTVIILVLVGLSTPLFRKPFRNIQLKNTCRNLVQLMRYGQAKTIAERRLSRVNLDVGKGIFWLTVQDDTSPAEFKRIKERRGRTFKIPDNISIDSEISFITFYPDGSSDKAEIKISDNKGKAFIITTQRAIRYAEVEE